MYKKSDLVVTAYVEPRVFDSLEQWALDKGDPVFRTSEQSLFFGGLRFTEAGIYFTGPGAELTDKEQHHCMPLSLLIKRADVMTGFYVTSH